MEGGGSSASGCQHGAATEQLTPAWRWGA